MIILLKHGADSGRVEKLKADLVQKGFALHISEGETHTIVGLVGDTSKLDEDSLASCEIVEAVKRIQEPYKSANRKFHPHDTVVRVGSAAIGGGEFCMIAGPCSVESDEQLSEIARSVARSGAAILRGGAFKPRTSPYAFQGLREKGIEILKEASRRSGLPFVTEIMDLSHLSFFEEADMIQVGARNMQNFELLKELGHFGKPILLKRGLANTVEEFLMSAEYIMSGGNEQIVLCERGIRTFETATRNTLDLSVIPVLKEKTHLPVVVDPSHATGNRSYVAPMAVAAAAAGADGVMIEVHNDPPRALCDGRQSLAPEEFSALAEKIRAVLPYRYSYER